MFIMHFNISLSTFLAVEVENSPNSRTLDVDDGSTVTDFLPAERARGITIQSAAITFHWPPESDDAQQASSNPAAHKTATALLSRPLHTINLIDTPGHADFTFEVLRSLRILDGAVCILDGVAGVEAQTEKVWYQANSYKIPKIIYVNKLDRDGAAFGRTVREIASKLHVWPAVCQIPWFENGNGAFIGVVDVVDLKALRWPAGGDGKFFKTMDMTELAAINPVLEKEAKKARTALVELLSEHDDMMVEKYLDCEEDHMAISPSAILESLHRLLLNGSANIVPVFAGASFRNTGVQPLLDAVIGLLPSPEEAIDPEVTVGELKGTMHDLVSGKLLQPSSEKPVKGKRTSSLQKSPAVMIQHLKACALAFKVVNDVKRGVLVYVRVYHGMLDRHVVLFNTNLQVAERAPRLLKMYASDAIEVSSIAAGQIGVIPGLKYARTGDTLVSYSGQTPKTGLPAPLNDLRLRPIEVPPPVFFASIESHSLSEEKTVTDALALLLREDPSLQLSVDEDSGQTLLSGMGELHLEIARDRLINDFKAKASMGNIEISFREAILAEAGPEYVLFDREIAGRKGKAGCSATVAPYNGDEERYSDDSFEQDGNLITVSIRESSNDEQSALPLPPHLTPSLIHTALTNGALVALARGPLHSFSIHSTSVSLSFNPATDLFGADTTLASLSSAARLAVQATLRASAKTTPTVLMEPVMNVIISVDEPSLGAVVHDLSSARGGHIVSLDDEDIISATSPGSSRADVEVIDIRRVYTPPDPFEAGGAAGGEGLAMSSRQRTITARVPLKEMVGYLRHLRSLTAGRGTFVMSVDRFERMGAQRERVVLRELRGS